MDEWSTALCLWHRQSWVQALKLHQCLWICAQVCGSKRLSCHADLYTVSRCHTRGESQEFIARRWQSTQVRHPPWLWNPGETSPEVQKRGISGPMKRTNVLLKFKKKEKKLCNNFPSGCWDVRDICKCCKGKIPEKFCLFSRSEITNVVVLVQNFLCSFRVMHRFQPISRSVLAHLSSPDRCVAYLITVKHIFSHHNKNTDPCLLSRNRTGKTCPPIKFFSILNLKIHLIDLIKWKKVKSKRFCEVWNTQPS